MTVGSPTRLILTFAFPMIISNIGQQLYSIVDTAIVGRGVGVSALAAVGSTTWIYGIILWSIMALTSGFSTYVSRYFGMGNKDLINRTLASSAVLSLIIGVIFTLLGLVFSLPVLKLLKTPSDIIEDAALYLYVMVLGTLPVMGYNLTSSILRAFGDGKSPLIAMIIAAVLNVGLDVLLVIVFPFGVLGAALATVISQLVSFVYCLFEIKKIEYVDLKKEHFLGNGALSLELLRFSMPLSLQNAILSAGGLVLQSAVNLEGSIFIAGYTATNRLYGMFECTAIALGHSITTFISQNFGIKDYKRVKKGFKVSFYILVVFSVIVMLLMFLCGKPLLKLFIAPDEVGASESLAIAYKYLCIMLFSLVILYLIYLYRCTLQAIGISLWSMLSGFAEFAARVIFATTIYNAFGAVSIYFVEPAAWLAALLLVIFPCYHHLKKLKDYSLTSDNS